MKTAILISGHMRTFDRCLPTLHWHVFRHFPGADFFVSTVADADAPKANLLRDKYPAARVEIEAIVQPELPIPAPPTSPDWSLGRMYSHEPYMLSVHPQAVLRQLWHLEKCWEFFNRTSARAAEGYDLIIRCRPDLWFRSLRWPDIDEHGRELHVTGAMTPWWGRFGGVNDRFAILGAAAATAYFTTYSRIPALLAAGCPLHPESLVKASLEKDGVTIADALRAEFATLRPDGELRDMEITQTDIAHLAASK